MKIRYNIAEKKRLNYLRFSLISIILTIISLALILLGTMNLSMAAKQFADKKIKLKIYEDKLDEIKKKNKEQINEIEGIKKKWDKEIKFINHLIKTKTFSFMDLLGKLEETIPAGVFLKKLDINTDSGNRANVTIIAVSSAKLIEAYKAFEKYNASYKGETIDSGLYRASLQINLD